MAAASDERPIHNVLGNPNDFNDLYRPLSVKVVFFTIASAKISNTGAILILRIGSAASIPIASHERNLERYKIISRVPPSCTTKQRIRRRLSSQRPPSVVIMAAKNKCLAQMNKSGTAGKATKNASNPASRVDPMGPDHRVVPAIKQAAAMEPKSHIVFLELRHEAARYESALTNQSGRSRDRAEGGCGLVAPSLKS